MKVILPILVALLGACSGRSECEDHGVDSDRDGFTACDDCDDEDPAVRPDLFECCGGVNEEVVLHCNGRDDDCDDEVDEAPNECDQDG